MAHEQLILVDVMHFLLHRKVMWTLDYIYVLDYVTVYEFIF